MTDNEKNDIFKNTKLNENHSTINSIDDDLDNFINIFNDMQDEDLEKKFSDLIDKEIKKRIIRTTKATFAKLILLVFTLVILINPIVKSLYPNFVDLAIGKPQDRSVVNTIRLEFKKFGIGILGIFSDATPLIDENIHTSWGESKLKEMLTSFIEIASPTNRLSYVGVRDKGYGKYDFYLNLDGPFNTFVSSKPRYDSNNIRYIRGRTESDITMDVSVYEPQDKKDYLNSIKKLPDSAMIFASIGLREPTPILDLLRRMENDYSVLPIWLRVVSEKEHKSIEKEFKLFQKTKNESVMTSYVTELGIRPESIYKKIPVKTKLDDGSIEISHKLISIRDDIEKMDDNTLKMSYVNQLSLIEKNKDIFNTFYSIIKTQPHYSVDSDGNIINDGISFCDSKIGDFEDNKMNDFSNYADINTYKKDIEKSKKLQTNLFTIVVNKSTLIKILNTDDVDKVLILGDRLSSYSNTIVN